MAGVYYYFAFACFYLALNSGRSVKAEDTLRCQAVMAAIKMNSTWSVRYSPKVISWLRPADGSTVIKPCYCDPRVGGLGNVSRIEYKNLSTGVVYSNNLCLDCPGQQVLVTDFNFTVVVIDKGSAYTDTGPCVDVPVYRCNCPDLTTTKPTTTPTTTPTTKLTTTKMPTTTGVDPYHP